MMLPPQVLSPHHVVFVPHVVSQAVDHGVGFHDDFNVSAFVVTPNDNLVIATLP